MCVLLNPISYTNQQSLFPSYDALSHTNQFTFSHTNPPTLTIFPQPFIVCLSPAFSQYVASMYWSFFTLFGVGFGDIHAVNTGERFFSVVVMMIGTIFQGAIISKVTIEGCCPLSPSFFDNAIMQPHNTTSQLNLTTSLPQSVLCRCHGSSRVTIY